MSGQEGRTGDASQVGMAPHTTGGDGEGESPEAATKDVTREEDTSSTERGIRRMRLEKDEND